MKTPTVPHLDALWKRQIAAFSTVYVNRGRVVTERDAADESEPECRP